MHVFDESREMYLETILVLDQETGFVRSVDIANRLEYSKPSVSRAVKNMISDKLIIMHNNGRIELTELGLEQAEGVLEKHHVLTEFFKHELGLDAELAESDACKVEHVISEETFKAIKSKVKEIS